MTSNLYIKNLIKELISQFTNLRVRYDHDFFSDTHSIEVIPNEVYNNDETFNEWQNTAIMDFIKNYPDESICFITDNSILGLDKYQFEYIGMFYGKEQPDCFLKNYAFISHDILYSNTINTLFNRYVPSFSNISSNNINIDSHKDLVFSSYVKYIGHDSIYPRCCGLPVLSTQLAQVNIEDPFVTDSEDSYINAA